jgi:CHAT domain-containing protein
LAAALTSFRSAREAAEKAADELGVSEALLNIGMVQSIQGKSRESLESIEASLKIAKAKSDKRLILAALRNRGYAYMVAGQLRPALSDYQAALEIAESLNDKKSIGRLLQNMGDVDAEIGNQNEALDHFEKALATLETDGTDKRGMAISLERIGVIHLRQGNNATALEYFQRSLTTIGPDADKEFSRHLWNDFGQVHEAQRDFEQALNYYRKSLAIAKESEDERGQGVALENIGITEGEQGAYLAAIRDFQKSLDIFERTDTKDGILAVLGNLGEAEYGEGHFEKALEYEKKSQALAESLSDQENLATAVAYIALINIKQRSFNEALVHVKEAMEIAERLSSQDMLWQFQQISGMAYRGLGKTEEARKSFLASISTVEQLRTQVAGGEEQQQGFLSMRLEPYYGMVELLTAQKQPAEALEYAELAKGRALLDVLRRGKVQITKAMTAEERERERQLQAEMTALNKQMGQENSNEKPDPRRLADLQGRVEAARLRYSDFQTNLFASHPELKTQRGQAQPVSLQEAAQLLPDSKSAFLEFVTGEEQTYLFVLTRQDETEHAVPELRVHTIHLTNKRLKLLAEQFRGQLARRDLAFKTTSQDLFRMLIAPAKTQLAGKTALVIVPDGPLWNLPFQALLNDSQYMLEDYAIAYAPSLTVLREMMRLHQKRLPITAQSTTLLAMADPVLQKETIQRAALSYRDENLGPLPEAKQEAIELKQLYGNEQSKVYTGKDAGEDRFKAEAAQFRILHLATHGIFNDASPMYSNVLLSEGQAETGDDGLLEAWEIIQMDLKADLAVLSACETGRGRFSRGEGLIGLTWAFFVAGVPTTVVSQWKVESASTAKLMLAFHRSLRAADAQRSSAFATARALQRAEVQLLHSQQYSHPFYWAGFVVVGDPQ